MAGWRCTQQAPKRLWLSWSAGCGKGLPIRMSGALKSGMRRCAKPLPFASSLPGDTMVELKKLIREVPDFPKPGILFYDITTLLKDAHGLRALICALADHYQDKRPDVVVGIEARGFVFGPALAYRLDRKS